MSHLAQSIQKVLKQVPKEVYEKITEVRLKRGQPLLICTFDGQSFLTYDGQLVHITDCPKKNVYVVTQDDWDRTLQLVTFGSLYAIERELRSGFITLPGGNRVGITGSAVYQDGKLVTLSKISSLNFRVAREIDNISADILPYIIDVSKAMKSKLRNTIILSPPGMGKTTLLRDITKKVSFGVSELGYLGDLVGVVDERSEIAGSIDGVPQFNLGPRCDVLDGCMKPEGILMLVRSMNPGVIITDEIGTREDTCALMSAANSGVKILTTAHSNNLSSAMKKNDLKSIIESSFIDIVVTLGNSLGIGTIEEIYSLKDQNNLINKPFRLTARC